MIIALGGYPKLGLSDTIHCFLFANDSDYVVLPAKKTEIEPVAIKDALARPLRDLRVSVIDRCNFRCPYCMPESQYPEHHAFLPSSKRMTFEQIHQVVHAFAQIGVAKVRITGGEPLLRKGLPDLVETLSQIQGVDDLALTTNGLLLQQMARPLFESGLNRITLSLDSLDPQTFAKMNGDRGQLKQILAGIETAEKVGFKSLKINVVVQKGTNEKGILDLLSYFRHSNHVVRLIEFMDVGTENHWQYHQVVPSAELRDQIHQKWPLKALEENYPGEVARRYAYEDEAGEIGFISSVSEPFCGDCSRARLSTDGKLYTCLFAQDGLDLKPHLSQDLPFEHLQSVIQKHWQERHDRYSEEREPEKAQSLSGKRIEMYQIGG